MREATVVVDGDNIVNKRVDSYEGIDGPPGYPLTSYLPKLKTPRAKIEAALLPAYSVEESVAHMESNPGMKLLPFKEKRLLDTVFVYSGKIYKGSHFPLVVFTENNNSRRSPGAIIRRNRTSYVQ